MYAPNLPEPWIVEELERMRRIQDSDGERAQIPLPVPPPPPPARETHERSEGSRVIVIDLA